MAYESSPAPEQLTLLAEVVRKVARSRRLTPDDAEDFAQIVQVKVLERNYDIFHRFTGRSSLRTYLTVVVTRMLLDWLNATYGKWRPSAAAVRLGADAIKLDRLIWRDSYTIDEAVSIVSAGPTSLDPGQLHALAVRLPHRLPRRRVPEMVLDQHQVMDFEDPVEVAERRRARLVAATALKTALGGLLPEDRSLLGMRYLRRLPVQVIAEMLRVEPKRLYRRFEQLLRRLRRALIARGITGPDVIDLAMTFHMPPAAQQSRRMSTPHG